MTRKFKKILSMGTNFCFCFFFPYRHKFVLAYLPVIAFYHWGKVIYKFDLEDSYEEMMDQLVKMTGKVQRTSSRFLYAHYDYENNTIHTIIAHKEV